MTEAHLVTAREAEELLGVPRNTIKAWRRRRLITPWGIDHNGQHLYVAAEIRAVAATAHARPSRRRSA